jgi:hypothetical protein
MTEKERQYALTDALDLLSLQRHKKSWCFLDEDRRVAVTSEVLRRRPELAPPDYSITTVAHDPNAAPRDRAAREQAAARRYGFSEADVQADPLKASLVAHLAHSEQRASSADEFDAAIRELGRRHGLNPEIYSERLELGRVMACSGHKLADRS